MTEFEQFWTFQVKAAARNSARRLTAVPKPPTAPLLSPNVPRLTPRRDLQL